jgi:hypothetical protein
MSEVGTAVTAAFDQMTLADLCRRAAQSRRGGLHAPMYEI